jgi:hypothetical protein
VACWTKLPELEVAVREKWFAFYLAFSLERMRGLLEVVELQHIAERLLPLRRELF